MTDRAPEPSPLERAISRVGDRWTLLVVNALMEGPRRFGELQQTLPGIAPNVLSQRLKRLEEHGVVVAQPYTRRPPRFAYELTAAGRELAGAMTMLAQWGAAQVAEANEDAALHHQACGTPMEARWWCPTCDRPVEEGPETDIRFV